MIAASVSARKPPPPRVEHRRRPPIPRLPPRRNEITEQGVVGQRWHRPQKLSSSDGRGARGNCRPFPDSAMRAPGMQNAPRSGLWIFKLRHVVLLLQPRGPPPAGHCCSQTCQRRWWTAPRGCPPHRLSPTFSYSFQNETIFPLRAPGGLLRAQRQSPTRHLLGGRRLGWHLRGLPRKRLTDDPSLRLGVQHVSDRKS